jgi:hypothetical protein
MSATTTGTTTRTTPDGAAKARPVPAPAEAPAEAAVVRLKRLQDATITVDIQGLTPLIPHKWAEKSLEMMRQKQFGNTVRPARVPKNPEEEAHAATYWLDDGRPGMPAVAFKAAMVGACRNFEGLPMTQAKTLFFVEGEGVEQLVPVEGPLSMREDTPRNANGTVDLRYRNAIFPWRASIRVRFLASRIDATSVIALLDAAGRGGVGDWRPAAPKSNTGSYGQWRVVDGATTETGPEGV